MQWYYASGGVQNGPLEDHEFHDRMRRGDLTPETPVWREGMPTWVPYGQISGRNVESATPRRKLTLRGTEGEEATPEPTSPRAAAPSNDPVTAVATSLTGTTSTPAPIAIPLASRGVALLEPLYRGRKWIRLTGIINIIGGAFFALSIVGIPIAWLPIWMGVLLVKSANFLDTAYVRGDESSMVMAMDKLRLYFKITGVLVLIGLIGSGLTFLAAGLLNFL